MALNYALIDTVSGKLKNSGVAPGTPFSDQDYDVASDMTTFTATGDITASNKVDVFHNGLLMREGASNDFTRNAATDQITFNFTVKTGAWVRIRIYL